MRRARSLVDKMPKWKFINVFNGDDVHIFELNDQERLVKKFPKMKPRKLCQEIPKLKCYPAPYQFPFQNIMIQAQSFFPPISFNFMQNTINTAPDNNSEVQKEKVVSSNPTKDDNSINPEDQIVFDDHLINELGDQSNFDIFNDDFTDSNLFDIPLSNDAIADLFALNAL